MGLDGFGPGGLGRERDILAEADGSPHKMMNTNKFVNLEFPDGDEEIDGGDKQKNDENGKEEGVKQGKALELDRKQQSYAENNTSKESLPPPDPTPRTFSELTSTLLDTLDL